MISGFYLMRWMSETVFFNLTFSDIRTSFIILILETGRTQPIPAIDLLTKSSPSAHFSQALCTKNPAKRGATTGHCQPPYFSRNGWDRAGMIDPGNEGIFHLSICGVELARQPTYISKKVFL